jgi:hypothetical protein
MIGLIEAAEPKQAKRGPHKKPCERNTASGFYTGPSVTAYLVRTRFPGDEPYSEHLVSPSTPT